MMDLFVQIIKAIGRRIFKRVLWIREYLVDVLLWVIRILIGRRQDLSVISDDTIKMCSELIKDLAVELEKARAEAKKMRGEFDIMRQNYRTKHLELRAYKYTYLLQFRSKDGIKLKNLIDIIAFIKDSGLVRSLGENIIFPVNIAVYPGGWESIGLTYPSIPVEDFLDRLYVVRRVGNRIYVFNFLPMLKDQWFFKPEEKVVYNNPLLALYSSSMIVTAIAPGKEKLAEGLDKDTIYYGNTLLQLDGKLQTGHGIEEAMVECSVCLSRLLVRNPPDLVKMGDLIFEEEGLPYSYFDYDGRIYCVDTRYYKEHPRSDCFTFNAKDYAKYLKELEARAKKRSESK